MYWLSLNDRQTKWLITIPGDTPFIPMNIVAQFKSKFSQLLIIPKLSIEYKESVLELNKKLETQEEDRQFGCVRKGM